MFHEKHLHFDDFFRNLPKKCVNVGAPTFLALILFLSLAIATRGDDAMNVLEADKAFVTATANPSAAALTPILAPQFNWIDSVGKRFSRAEVLEKTPTLANAQVAPEVKVYGRSAVVRANQGKMNVLRIWNRSKTGWQLLHYQEVRQVEKNEAPGGEEVTECINPCKQIPFKPATYSEKEAIDSWQGVMKAMAENDAALYSPLIAEEFVATDTYHDHPYTKADRLAQIEKQKSTGKHSAPPEMISADMYDLSGAVVMIAREQRKGAKAYFNTRMWIRRDTRWQMLFSFNTRIE